MKKAFILLLLTLMVASNSLSGTALASPEKEFVLVSSLTTENLNAIWGTAINDVYAVGENGVILHYDGTSWTNMISNTKAHLAAIWGVSNKNIYAVGYYGGPLWAAGYSWAEKDYSGVILHYNGAKWSTVKTVPNVYFTAVGGTDSYICVSGGDKTSNKGIIYLKEGSDWTRKYTSNSNIHYYQDIWGYLYGETHEYIYFAGRNLWYSEVLLYKPDVIKPFTVEIGKYYYVLNGIWGAAPSEWKIFAVGGYSNEDSKGLYYDFSTWQDIAISGKGELIDVWGFSATDVYTVGKGGKILHFDGTGWSAIKSGVTKDLNSVWGSSSDDFFAVGNGGTILRLNSSPNKPTNNLPVNGASDVSLTPRLESSAFSDPDSGNTHAASQWQITTTSGDYSATVYDSDTDTENKVSLIVPGGTLVPDTVYYWRVRHQDNYNAWSDWSNETSFTPTLEGSLPKPGLTPDNPIYFLKTWRERVTLFFTFDVEKKAKKALGFAELKLAEIKAMADKNNSQALKKAQQQYEKYMQVVNNNVQKAKEDGKNVDQLTKLINEKTAKNQQILNNILGTQPELVGDTDGDGVTDDVDQCVNQAGPIANNGCPYVDTDGDGVFDDIDVCVTEAGPASNNGCPLIDCDDGDRCTIDSYDATTASCIHNPVNCDDGDLCTIDKCFPEYGCGHANITCNDNNPCTNDMCDKGQCINTAKDCNDDDARTIDSCDTATGLCKHTFFDTDGDGLKDDVDQCINQAGPASNNGCPYPDTDGDGVTDDVDNCDTLAGPASNNGCPEDDDDGDGVVDSMDPCPNEYGPIINDGCPYGDYDGDGLTDDIDECDDQPGPASNNGCPLP